MAQQPPANPLPLLPPPPVLPMQPQPVVGAAQGGVPAAAPMPGIAPPLAQAVNHTSFASYYHDDTKDPLRSRAAAVLARFEAEGQAAVAGADLLQAVLENKEIPNTFLCCAVLHANTPAKVYVLHALSKYPQALDGTVSPWDGKHFCYLGDISQGNVLTVAVPSTACDVGNTVRVYDDNTLALQVAQQGNDLFPKLAANAAGSQALRTRPLMRLPTKYAPLVMSARGYSPREAYALLLDAFTTDNFLNHAGPVLSWLRVAMHATRADNSGPPGNSLQLVAPFMDEDLSNHRGQILNAMLPSRNAPSTGLEAALTQFAAAVASQTAEDRTARLAREVERDLPTTPSTKFGLLIDSLKNLLHVEEEAELPDFWFQFSAAKKKQEFSILREYLDAYARSERAFIAVAPIATPKIHSDLSTVTFLADHQDDLKSGIQPFVVMDGSAEYRASLTELSRSFGLLYEREYGVSFNDLGQFKVPKELRSYPTNYFDLEQNIGVFGNFLGAILGENHPLTANLRLFWDALTKQYRVRIRQFIDSPRNSLKPVHILRSIQMICFDWFEAKKALVTPETPNFISILRHLSHGTYQPPLLPLPLYQLVTGKASPIFPGSGGSSLTGTSVSDDASTIAPSVNSQLSAVTGATGLSGTTGLSGSVNNPRLTSNTNTLIVNENPDPQLLALIPFNRKIRDIMGNTQPPTTDAGDPLCLSFHAKGGCYSNCRRKKNHGHILSQAEKERLANYIADRLEKAKNN